MCKRLLLIILNSLLCFYPAYILAATEKTNSPASNATPLIEVTKKTQASCVEFFEVNKKQYCSTAALLNTQIANEIVEAEKFKFTFDMKAWKAGWTDIKTDVVTIEYVPHGQTVKTWQEMLTTQFLPNFTQNISPKLLALNFINDFQQKGLSPSTTFYNENNSSVIFEFQISSPELVAQDEIQKIVISEQGLHILHYIVKKADMGEIQRQKWLKILTETQLKIPSN